jgi:hypothetical protein
MDEKVCKQFLLLNRDRLPFTITKLGRWWHKDVDWNCGKRKEHFGLIAKKIADKERLRKEGYFAFLYLHFSAFSNTPKTLYNPN